jgi:hypothetical protein
MSILHDAFAELKVNELKFVHAFLRSMQYFFAMTCVPPSLQRKLPADSKVLEAAHLVYTVSAQEYWQQAFLTEEETGN